MELINEINIIKNLMNLNVLNEAAPLAWVDEVWKAVKSIFTNFFSVFTYNFKYFT